MAHFSTSTMDEILRDYVDENFDFENGIKKVYYLGIGTGSPTEILYAVEAYVNADPMDKTFEGKRFTVPKLIVEEFVSNAIKNLII